MDSEPAMTDHETNFDSVRELNEYVIQECASCQKSKFYAMNHYEKDQKYIANATISLYKCIIHPDLKYGICSAYCISKRVCETKMCSKGLPK